MPNPTISRRQEESAALRDVWKRYEAGVKGNRKALADKYGVSVAFIGLMLNGHTSISGLWKLRMAEHLEVPVQEIWPDFELHKVISEQLPPHLAELLEMGAAMSPDRVKALIALMKTQ